MIAVCINELNPRAHNRLCECEHGAFAHYRIGTNPYKRGECSRCSCLLFTEKLHRGRGAGEWRKYGGTKTR